MGWADPNVRLPHLPPTFSPNRGCRPPDPSAAIQLGIYASFEFQPMLGDGELLRTLALTVDQLLDRSSKDVREWDRVLHTGLSAYFISAFTFFPKDGDVASPCSSLLVTISRWHPGIGDLSEPRVFYRHCVSTPLMTMSLSLICACV